MVNTLGKYFNTIFYIKLYNHLIKNTFFQKLQIVLFLIKINIHNNQYAMPMT